MVHRTGHEGDCGGASPALASRQAIPGPTVLGVRPAPTGPRLLLPRDGAMWPQLSVLAQSSMSPARPLLVAVRRNALNAWAYVVASAFALASGSPSAAGTRSTWVA